MALHVMHVSTIWKVMYGRCVFYSDMHEPLTASHAPLAVCRYDPYLEFVVTYTEDLAYSQAARADRMFSEVRHSHLFVNCFTEICKSWTSIG